LLVEAGDVSGILEPDDVADFQKSAKGDFPNSSGSGTLRETFLVDGTCLKMFEATAGLPAMSRLKFDLIWASLFLGVGLRWRLGSVDGISLYQLLQ